MRSINKAVLLGNLAADPDEKVLPKGQSMVSFPLATHREYEQDGERKKSTDFHRIVIWGKLAQVAKQYLAKGSAVYLEGKIVNRTYADQGGDRRFITEIVADEINILTWKAEKEQAKLVGSNGPVSATN